MANDLNQCQFIGRLGQDPETSYMPNGTAVTKISIACGWKGKDREGVEWIPIVAFGKLAEIMSQYLRKGSQVYISGRFKTDKYEHNGESRYSTKIVADNLQMLGGKDSAPQQGQQRPQGGHQNSQQQPQQQPSQPQGGYTEGFDDDIPF